MYPKKPSRGCARMVNGGALLLERVDDLPARLAGGVVRAVGGDDGAVVRQGEGDEVAELDGGRLHPDGRGHVGLEEQLPAGGAVVGDEVVVGGDGELDAL